MVTLKLILQIVLCVWLSTQILLAQGNGRITGSTVDKATGQGVRGVNVSIEGTYYGTVSDAEGKFAISASIPAPFTIVVERASYSPAKVAVKDRTAPIRIELQNRSAGTETAEVQATAEEYNLKLLLLEKFIQQISWDSAGTDPSKSFVIGVLGDNPFGDAAFALEHKKIQGRAVELVFASGAEDLNGLNVLFVAATKRNKKLYADLVSILATRQILTVSDDKQGLGNPAMIAFYQAGGFLKFSLQPALAQEVGIGMSASLLKMGE